MVCLGHLIHLLHRPDERNEQDKPNEPELLTVLVRTE